jgi:Tfp pilus assembly protein PilV
MMIGTLIWIGDTTSAEFRGAVQYCLLNVSQLAFRRDIAEAESRSASDVRWILFAQSDRSHFERQRLVDRYPGAKLFNLRGPLCQGMGHSSDAAGCDWQRWEQELPAWFGFKTSESPRCRTVAVVAATLSTAEPLLDLAQSCGATAVWCRNASAHRLRNMDAVWWDDSVATPASQQVWMSRMDSFARADKPVQHAWIASSPTLLDAQQARSAGIGWLVSKPHRIDSLVRMLDQVEVTRPTLRARAA